MVDRVQERLERLAPELLDYSNRKIFTPKEIMKITDTRRLFETRLCRSKRRIEDFLQYLESEKKLDKIKNRRMRSMRCPSSEMDLIIRKNISDIYRRAIYQFPEPFLVREYSEYCVKNSFYDEMKTLLSELCLRRTGDTDLWVYTAQKLWDINDIDSARNVFLQATSVNHDCRLLVEFFRLEVAYAERTNQINQELHIEEDDKGDIEKGAVALAVYRSLLPEASASELRECLEIAKAVPGLADRVGECMGEYRSQSSVN